MDWEDVKQFLEVATGGSTLAASRLQSLTGRLYSVFGTLLYVFEFGFHGPNRDGNYLWLRGKLDRENAHHANAGQYKRSAGTALMVA